MIPVYIKEASKIIGYFSYTAAGNVSCDGDACIIAGSEELIKQYLEKMPKSSQRDIIKKTRFGEIIEGLRRGGEYAFDEESYKRFLHFAKMNKMTDLPEGDVFSGLASEEDMRFVRIQIA